MTIKIERKTKEEIKQEKKLTNGIYAVWFLGFINGTLLVSTIITFYIKEFLLGIAMLILYIMTLPPIRKEKFMIMFKETKK